MNPAKLTESLRGIYETEGHRIVFWYDDSREFESDLAALDLPEVKIIRRNEISDLALKIQLEIEDLESRYLLYAPFAEPAIGKNWLLDIQLYSRIFHADSASMVLDELGLTHQALRFHIEKRKQFFASKDRLNRLKRFVHPSDAERDLDMKMLAVLVRADQPTFFEILMKLFGEYCDKGECDLSAPPKSWSDIEKFGIAETFWDLAKNEFAYAEQEPNLRDLLIRLMIADFARYFNGGLPQSMRHFLLSANTQSVNASVFLSHWRLNITHHVNYDSVARHIEDEMKLEAHLRDFDESALLEVMTFEAVEKQIIRNLRDKVIINKTEEFEQVKEVIKKRRDGYWARASSDAESGSHYRSVYDAIEAAADLLALRNKYVNGLSYASAEAMYAAYIEELFRFDQFYRLFHEAADKVELQGWDVLKVLRDVVEDCYSGWFIDQLAAAWSIFIEDANNQGLIRQWKLKEIPNQQDFYKKFVQPILDLSPHSKAYVIISDAFRFEAAEELAREINGKNRLQARLNTHLGVLPSYTALGMASLLPHDKLDYKHTSNLDLMADGQVVSSFIERAKALGKVQGTAIKVEDLIAMSRDEGREFVKNYRVIYIYHNQVDAIGDTASTESQTFSAVRVAINELSALVRHIINKLNGSNVLITADHGFLYQEVSPRLPDRSGLASKPSGTLRAKKRYLIGDNLGKEINVWHSNTRITANTETEMEFWIPKGANRFHFTGGARFIHGGAMLQEIVVPIVQVKELKGLEAEKSVVRKVSVSLLGSNRRVSNNVQRFEFIQTEPVSDRVQPRILLISLRKGGELISNEETITFDSASQSLEDRKQVSQLVIKTGQYDKTFEYALVLRDADTKIEYERYPITIDLAFTNDF